MSVRIASNKPVVLLILKICILLSVYIIYKILIVNSEATMSLLNPLFNSYMELVRSITNFLLGKIGSAAQITEHNMVADNLRVIAIGHQFMIKKWLYLLISAVILTPSTPRLRTIFSFILALVYTVSVSLLMAIYAHLISHFTHTQAKDMASAFSIICLVAWLYFWIRLNRKYIAQRLPGMNAGTIYRKLNEIILAIFLFVIIRYLIVGYFDFLYWITFLFTASQKILAWFGYESFVEPFYLIGNNGAIYASKSCLGISTMYLFAALVFLTGNRKKTTWMAIGSGLLILTAVNILRFVLLFIHIQKYGDYMASVYVHNTYNFITYVIVFILWIIWFEKYSDLNPCLRIADSPSTRRI
ncbi:MAG TPA: hypothetical protein ENK25_07165 [Bacteroidetes bacterium]|nr:hypothetical protein [Bacteroidota bacterium]